MWTVRETAAFFWAEFMGAIRFLSRSSANIRLPPLANNARAPPVGNIRLSSCRDRRQGDLKLPSGSSRLYLHANRTGTHRLGYSLITWSNSAIALANRARFVGCTARSKAGLSSCSQTIPSWVWFTSAGEAEGVEAAEVLVARGVLGG